jgi:hypothetical protein
MRQHAIRDLEVVANEVALRQCRFRKVDLVEVRELNVVAADAHRHERSGGARANPLSGGRRALCDDTIIHVPAPLT